MSRVIVLFSVIFALLPGMIVFLASFSAGNSLAFPPREFTLHWYGVILGDPEFSSALLMSVMLAGVTSVVATAITLLAALAISRYRTPTTVLIEAFLLSPMVVPHVVIGIGILQIYIIYGLRADLMTLTTGHLIVTIPFALRLLLASIAGLDRRVEMAAASLGAPPFTIFRSVVLPQMKMGIAGALVAAFILSFDDVSLTIFLVQPGYTTIPILLFNQAENNPGPAIHAASVILLLASWIAIFLIDRLMGFERLAFASRK